MADTPDLGSGALRRGGSSPLIRTILTAMNIQIYFSDKFTKFNKSKLSKKDKKLYKIRGNSADFLLSRSIKSHIKKRGKFSISHKKFDPNLLNLAPNFANSQNYHIATVGLSKKKFGLDLEVLADRNYEAVINFCFNEFEKNLMQICNKNEKKILFYQIYTIKEAIIKLENLAFSDLARVGLCQDNSIIKAKNHKGKFIIFKTYLLYNKFLISVCFKG